MGDENMNVKYHGKRLNETCLIRFFSNSWTKSNRAYHVVVGSEWYRDVNCKKSFHAEIS